MLLIMYAYLLNITRDGMFGSILCASEQQRHFSSWWIRVHLIMQYIPKFHVIQLRPEFFY